MNRAVSKILVTFRWVGDRSSRPEAAADGYAGFAGHLRRPAMFGSGGFRRLLTAAIEGATSVRAARATRWQRSIPPSVALLLVTQRATRGADTQMDDTRGFKVADDAPVIPVADVAPETRQQLVRMLAAVVAGGTPEEVATYLRYGWPEVVTETLDRVGETDELSAHVDLLVSVVRGA